MIDTKDRVVFIDYIRFIACFMVMLVHSCEPFYLGGQGTFILNHTNALLVTLIDSFLRPCVPLFVIASSYLLFPVKTDAKSFYTRRAKRVLIPFLIWLLLYALIPLYGTTYEFYKAADIFTNLKQVLLNFPGAAGHLWFVYMLLGVYLIMPILSPWIEKLSKKGEQTFLSLWLFTTLVPFFRLIIKSFGGTPEVWGEANWNEFGTFYYISGFVGYLVLGHYFRTHVGELSWKKTLLISLPLVLVGYAISAGWFWFAIPKQFPVDAPIDLAVYMETSWGFSSIGVALLAIGLFLIFRKINSSGWTYKYLIRPVANVSYGMYLMHIFILCFFTTIFQNTIDSTLIVILLTAVSSYVCSFVLSFIISKIPKIGHYIIG